MRFLIAIQFADSRDDIPSATLLKKWCKAALTQQKVKTAELCIRIVGKKESAALNKKYRRKTGATNVLSFPAEMILGDLVICAPLVTSEAVQQGKSTRAHWAHLVVHGTLHLLGHDHIQRNDARIMEAREIKILRTLGFDNPYN